MPNLLLDAKNRDGDPKKKKLKSQYNKYSGVIDDNGKPVDNPTALQSMKTMVQYLKHNTPESNVYRPEHAHTSLLYSKKKPIITA